LPIGRVRGAVDGQILSMFASPQEMSGGSNSTLHRHLMLFTRIGELIAKPGHEHSFRVGYAGQTPAYVSRTLTPTDPSYIDGLTGSLATCLISIRYMLDNVVGVPLEEAILGFYGMGTIGGRMHGFMAREGAKLAVGYDPRFAGRDRTRENRRYSGDPASLAECDIILNAAPSGNDIMPAISYLKTGVVIACETHPRGNRVTMEAILSRGSLYMVGVQWPGVFIEPAFPGRIPEEIPGCLLETIAVERLSLQTRDVHRFVEEVAHPRVGVAYLEQKVTPENLGFYALDT
ncbi:MAG: hypothetical protein AAB737_00380, partial [Patescibacteria group bacterium]